ncbi:hypothetical protein QTL95_08680 [Rhizobium sp. S152]|uniref:hypothetical protein n=1 Tax=Rhizobium sp. S152 TaxID=3055038 RepID=UPI0025A9D972|nr:hypothetical protein [Rhizobium sp. S152]MDM9625968.1 hypothetical protein [Rhizobium sp. S152]
MAYPDCWHIISYPRSGNHAVRAIVERFSGRPTLGCPGNERDDPPLYLRKKNQSLNLIKIEDERCIGRKSHSLFDLIRHDAHEENAGLVLITRDPLDAITSHIYSLARPRLLKRKVRCDVLVQKAVQEYLAPIFAFRGMHNRKRIYVRYEDFVRPNSGIPAKLLQQMGLNDKQSTETEIVETLSLSFDSLRRPGRMNRDEKIVAAIKHEIAQRLNYADVMDLIRADASDTFVS